MDVTDDPDPPVTFIPDRCHGRPGNSEVPRCQAVVMPRRNGLDQSTYFHVWNRGADRQDIFFDPHDQELFERMIADAIERSGVRVHAYSLMTNHFHLIVEAEGAQLSDFMYWLGRSYAVWLNAVAGRTGPVFDGRFGSQPITDPTMLMVEGRYVHRNPLDITGLDSLVHYRFSSLGVYAGNRPNPGWLVTEVLAEPFADRAAHLRYVRRTLASDAQFSGRRPPLVEVAFDQLEAGVCAVTRVLPAQLRSSSPSARNDARIVAVTLAVELRLGSNRELADRFGYSSERVVRNVAAQGRRLVARERSFAGLRRRVLDRVLASSGMAQAA